MLYVKYMSLCMILDIALKIDLWIIAIKILWVVELETSHAR